ncbi:MAG: hypothetical protein RIS49_697 [Actinomycetota bacterium]
MISIDIKAERHYQVRIGTDFRDEIKDVATGRERIAFIFSEKMKDQLKNLEVGEAEPFYFAVPDSEVAKSTKTLLQLWDWLGAAGFTRSDLIVGIGGGAITDLSGFAAASWLRGIDWVAIPTTVAGMVDAAVGGKTGINPQRVIVDLQWLDTLSDRDFSAGLAEVVKCGFIRDTKILDVLKGKSLAEIRADKSLTTELIERSIRVKGDVVSGDYKESFDREILNYGHTFGHAVELDSKYALRHGECVSIGMIYVAELAYSLDLISESTLLLHRELLESLHLPITYSASSWSALLANMKLDKKSRGNTLRFVLLGEIGQTQRVEGPDEGALIAAYEKVSP